MKRSCSIPSLTAAAAGLLVVLGFGQPRGGFSFVGQVAHPQLPWYADHRPVAAPGLLLHDAAAASGRPPAARRRVLKMAQDDPAAPEGPAGSFFHRVPPEEPPPPQSSSSSGGGDDVDSEQRGGGDEALAAPGGGADVDNGATDVAVDASSNSTGTGTGGKGAADDLDDALFRLLERRRRPPRASRPSTINGVPTEKVASAAGFGTTTTPANKSKPSGSSSRRPYVALGPRDNDDDDGVPPPQHSPPSSSLPPVPVNDPTKPEFDDQGYTLYTDQETGKKSRVFEALVTYPCNFTLKIVGANEGDFVTDMLAVVADACDVDIVADGSSSGSSSSSPADVLVYSTKVVGKWTSVTVEAPVRDAQMLYALYERVDLDPRVKFKF